MLGFKRLAEVEATIRQKKLMREQQRSKMSRPQDPPESWIIFLFHQFIIRQYERGLLFKNGDFVGFLEPGTYRYFDPLRKITVEIYDLSIAEFNHPLLDFFLKDYSDVITRYLRVIELTPQQVALVFKQGQVADILPPASRMVYWKGIIEISTEIFNIGETFEIPHEQVAPLIYAKTGELSQRVKEAIYFKEVPEHQIGLLYVNGQYRQTLSAGLHAYWQYNRHINIELWDTRLQEMDISGQEILSKDKVSLRINLSAHYVIKDILRALSILSHPFDYLYKELQFGLRAAVGTRTLDQLLENKTIIDELVFGYICEKTADVGIEVRSVGVKDIILPGEMKTILNKVVETEKAAQANVIKRREETAATRSLLNTAKVMEGNPTALRLKELETLEKVTEKINNISVFGGLEGLLTELVKIKG